MIKKREKERGGGKRGEELLHRERQAEALKDEEVEV